MLFFGVCAIIACVPHGAQAYDDKTTHPALTDEIVSYYNAQYPDAQVTAQQREWMIEGSRLEDIWPRWVNHLFDPIHNTAWTGRGGGVVPQSVMQAFSKLTLSSSKPLTAPNWLNNYSGQESYARYGGNHSWEKGLEEIAVGNEQGAYTTLGHALHLIEDMGVPDHTRDDTHAHEAQFLTGDLGSPYELYAERWKRGTLHVAADLATAGAKAVAHTSPEDFLKDVAQYSNRYFFSKDTINDPLFKAPLITRVGDGFGYGRDEHGREFPLVRQEKVIGSDGRPTTTYLLLDTTADVPIFDAYFDRLSKQIVTDGAGMVHLFEQQAQAEQHTAGIAQHLAAIMPSGFLTDIISPAGEAYRLFKTTSSAITTIGTVLTNAYNKTIAAVLNTAEKIAAYFRSSSHDVAQIPAVDPRSANAGDHASDPSSDTFPATLHVPTKTASPKKTTSKTTASKSTVGTSIIEPNDGLSDTVSVTPKPSASPKAKLPAPVVFKQCDVATHQTPNGQVLFNEVAWMGSVVSATDEWIELKNPSATPVDLQGWQVVSVSGHIHLQIDTASKSVRATLLKPSSFYLIERTDDQTVPGVPADALYTGALSNSSVSGPEGLLLFDSGCRLVDRVFTDAGTSGKAWPAGDATTRATMERDAGALTWHTSTNPGGTPKAPNSAGRFTPTPSPTSTPKPSPQPSSTPSPSPLPPSPTPTPSPSPTPIPPSPTPPPPTPSPTPTSEPSSTPPATTTPPMPTFMPLASSTVFISEIQVGGVDAGDEFVELYNSGEEPVDLSGGSIQYVGGHNTITATSSISKKNIEGPALIPAHGFFMIARALDANGADGYRGSTAPDLSHRSFSLSGASAGAIVMIVSSSDYVTSMDAASIVDLVYYGGAVPTNGASIERKAFVGDGCVSAAPGTPGALSGNGCPGRDVSAFELRAAAEPQNTHSLLEPRESDGNEEATSTQPSLFDRIIFHADLNKNAHQAYVDFSLDPAYASWNDVSSSTPPWELVVPYLNKTPSTQQEITTASLSPSEPTDLRVIYRGCHGGEGVNAVVVIPLYSLACQSGGELSGSYRFGDLVEDGYVHVTLERSDGRPFTLGDYVTFVLYTFGGGRAGEIRFAFGSADPSAYQLTDTLEGLSPPGAPSGLRLSFDTLRNKLMLGWTAASDPDSTDALLQYEAALSLPDTPPEWQSAGADLAAWFPIEMTQRYIARVRAVDEYGLVSEEIFTVFEPPT